MFDPNGSSEPLAICMGKGEFKKGGLSLEVVLMGMGEVREGEESSLVELMGMGEVIVS